jgi:hypothetical protein
MRRVLFACAWAFTFLAAAYDGYFAWQYRHVLQEWELNPLVRWAAAAVGLAGVLAFKLAGLLFAAGLAAYCRRRRRELAWPLTLSVTLVYALLSLHYYLGSRLTEQPVAHLPSSGPPSSTFRAGRGGPPPFPVRPEPFGVSKGFWLRAVSPTRPGPGRWPRPHVPGSA